MGKEKRLFKSEERKSRSEVSAFLHQLADKVAEGQVTFRQSDNETAVCFSEQMFLEIQLEEKDKGKKGVRYSLEVEMKWFENDLQNGSLEIE